VLPVDPEPAEREPEIRIGRPIDSDRNWDRFFDVLGALFDAVDVPFVVLLFLLVLVAIPVVPVVLVVWEAPALLAELLLGGLLSAGLYRRLRGISGPDWLETVLRRTWLPFLVVLLTFAIAGAVLQGLAPEAVSIGGVLRHLFR
jgi:hypothetical protein